MNLSSPSSEQGGQHGKPSAKGEKLLASCILVWPFDKAPAIYQTLVELKGREKWLVYIPREASKLDLECLNAMNIAQTVDIYFGGQLRVGYRVEDMNSVEIPIKSDSTTEGGNNVS